MEDTPDDVILISRAFATHNVLNEMVVARNQALWQRQASPAVPRV